MKSSIIVEQSQSASLSLAMLEECGDESMYAPGYIQPHGVIIKLQEPHLKILQISENVEQFFGISAAALLGQNLQRLFSRTQVTRMIELLRQDNLALCNPFELKMRVKAPYSSSFSLEEKGQTNDRPSVSKKEKVKTQIFRSTLRRTADALILELERQPPTEKTHSIQFYQRLQTAILHLRSTTSLTELAQTLAREVKSITGFDRVMIYRFEADEHGIVIAEAKESHLESYLGLHYPATDIPHPSRKLFLRNWVRQIPDVNYTPAFLISADHSPNPQPIDLSDCVCRGVHPAHIEYLQNMGVAGSLTISLIDDKHLWGLIACHHYSSKLVDYETRKTCEFIGQFASIELVHQQERELGNYQTRIKSIQHNLQQAFLQEPNFIQQVLTGNANQLLDLVHAEGVAIVLEQQISLIGQTPALKDVQALLTWLLQMHQHDIYLTNCLARSYSPAQAFIDTASGVLIISIVLHQRSYHLLWFRPEQIQTVNWAGNPHTAVVVDPMGKERLTPRKSFELWKETVRETSLPWKTSEIEAALMMRNTLMLAVLEFSQAALEQAAERAAIANRAKSQFLAKMSHELRTPLNAILGFTQVMNRSPNTPTEFQEHLSIISRSGEHLLALINDVLEMSRIEAGQLTLTESHFNLQQLLRSLQKMFALKAAQKGLILFLGEDPNLPRYICSDESKLRQILINLISNAIKFTTQGSIMVSVSAELAGTVRPTCLCYPNAPSCKTLILSFTIQDTGCGIDQRDLESVFEAFMQTEQGRHAQGTGLGLSISRQFARLMGGDITVQSTVNQGSTFTCTVTVHQPELLEQVEAKTAHRIVGLAAGQPTYRILVVEDLPENRQLLQTLLEPIGFEVQTAENGVEAIAQWQHWHPHLIFMDIQMPVMDGYEATQQIRARESNLSMPLGSCDCSSNGSSCPTKIIALTAYAFANDRAASLQMGCDDYIAKPFTEATLFETIAHHLDVQYCYAEVEQTDVPLTYSSIAHNPLQTNAEPTASERKPLSRRDLEIMPSEWIAQVHEAALDLNDEKIQQLIAEIPQEAQGLLEGMIILVDNFQLEAIATLTQP